MGDYAGNIVKQHEKTKEKQQLTYKRQTTQDFSNPMMLEKESQQDIQRVNTAEFSELNLDKYTQQNMPELPIEEEDYDRLKMSKFNLEQSNQIQDEWEIIDSTRQIQAEEKLQKQPQELVENYKALLSFMKEFKDSCQNEISSSNSTLMNNVITQVTEFEKLVNSKEFSVGKQYSYIPQLVNMRNAVALYYEKNKGFKWTSKGRRRRALTKNILNKINEWVGNMPDAILDTYVAEMEKEEYEQIRDLESSKEMYMALGSAVLKKQLDSEGREMTDEKRREYLNPDSVRYISMARHWSACRDAIQNLKPSEAERKELEAQAKAKYGKTTVHSDRYFGYMWGQVKVNYDGSPADSEEAAKLENIKKSMKDWYSDEVSGMKPYFDEYIKKLIDYSIKLEKYTPEQMHKNGPALFAFADAVNTIQNMIESDTLAKKYVESLSPAVMFRLKKITDMTTFGPLIGMFVQGQNIAMGSQIKLKKSNEWLKPLDINKSKKLIDLMIKSPKEAEKIYRYTDALGEYDYFTELQETFEENGKEYKYVFYDNNGFECFIAEQMTSITIIGDYYSRRNNMARRAARAEMFYRDVPKFNLEHPELDEPICAVYQKLEDTEEKIANIDIELDSLTDEVEIEKKRRERADLYTERLYILKERDAIVEERDKNPGSPYTAYAYEAKKESERLGFTVSPEAVAVKKLQDLAYIHREQEKQHNDHEGVSKVLDSRQMSRMYFERTRFVNFKDGVPATEEDKKNLEWNRAYSKAIVENSHEDRVRLLKEYCEYTADLINKIDFDRISDINYWQQNPQLYVTFCNFTLGNMDLADSSILEADVEEMKKFYDDKTPMIKLLDDFVMAFGFLKGIFDRAGQSQGLFNRKYGPAPESDSGKRENEAVLASLPALVANVQESLAAYNVSKQK